MEQSDALRVDRLRAFVCFAEHLNFTRAARALHLSQPALHTQIRGLSAELGVPLYSRLGRRLDLTPEGTQLLAFARESQERAQSFLAQLRGRPDEGPVVLCAGAGACRYLLGDALRRYARHAVAPLRLLVRDRAGTVDALRAGEAHIGVAALEDLPEGLIAERLCDVGQVLVLPVRHPLARRRSVAVTDLQGAGLIVPAAGRPHRAILARALQAAGVTWHIAAEADGWDLIIHFAALGLGLAVVNSFCALPRGLAARSVRGLPSVRYVLLTRRGAALGEAAARLRQLILERVGKDRS